MSTVDGHSSVFWRCQISLHTPALVRQLPIMWLKPPEKWRHSWYFLRDFYPYEEASHQVAMSAAFCCKIFQLTPVDLFIQSPLELIWIRTNGLWHTVLEIVMLVSEIMHVWCVPQRCVPHLARTEAPACAGTSVCVPLAGLELVAAQVHAAGPQTQTIKELDSVTSRL